MDSNALQQQSGKIAAGMGIVGALFLIVRSLVFPEPPIPINQANGTFANDCCGTISLSDGTMRFGKQEVTYVIERDKGGAYILPQRYVGIYPGQGVQIERGRNRLKLRLDDENHPQTISILGSDKEYLFTR